MAASLMLQPFAARASRMRVASTPRRAASPSARMLAQVSATAPPICQGLVDVEQA